jgi:tyrosyl-tRNA synthetase
MFLSKNNKDNKQNPEEIVNSEKYIDDLLDRGVQEVLPSKRDFSEMLKKGKLRVYAGIDPTGPTLHIGHIIVLNKLSQFQKLGHEVILLIGDFTATIGDPTDKTSTRRVLTEKEVKNNLKLYVKQASKTLDFKGKNKVKVVYNSKWLKKMSLKDVLDLSSMMTVDQMMKRDMFKTRSDTGKPVYIHEFMYPLMQGYDSVVLDVDVEVGGNDQMFNMMVGREFQKKKNNKEKFCITMKLLTDNTGKKMGKSEGNMVSLLDNSFEMFGKIMSWTDDMIKNGFELCTDKNLSYIEEMVTSLLGGSINPRDVKLKLAYEITKIYHGEDGANEARENFINTFSKKEVPENIQEIFVNTQTPLSLILLNEGMVQSIGEFKRLVKEGAVITMDTQQKIDDFNYKIEYPMVVKVGKRRYLDIKVK